MSCLKLTKGDSGERCRLVVWVITMMSSAFGDTAWRLSMVSTTSCFCFRFSSYHHVITLSSTAHLWRLPLPFSSSGHGRSRLCLRFGSFKNLLLAKFSFRSSFMGRWVRLTMFNRLSGYFGSSRGLYGSRAIFYSFKRLQRFCMFYFCLHFWFSFFIFCL